jgi:hypothetical protein
MAARAGRIVLRPERPLWVIFDRVKLGFPVGSFRFAPRADIPLAPAFMSTRPSMNDREAAGSVRAMAALVATLEDKRAGRDILEPRGKKTMPTYLATKRYGFSRASHG